VPVGVAFSPSAWQNVPDSDFVLILCVGFDFLQAGGETFFLARVARRFFWRGWRERHPYSYLNQSEL